MSHPAAKAVIGFYHRHAEQWDTLRQRYFAEKAWLDRFLSYLAPDSQILDLGCGSGCPIAAYFIDHQHHITGVDSSKPLINLCQQRFPTQRWMESDMRHLSLNQTYQGILAWDSFFHLVKEDQRAMFDIFKQHAIQGSVFMFTTGTHDGEAINDFLGEPLYHASLSPNEYHSLLNSHGFDVIDMVASDPDCGGRTVWLAQFHQQDN